MKNVFIDANIWLSLFHFSGDDLEEFKKLKELIGTDLTLFLPEQIRDEVYRNRENKIKDAFEKFEKLQLQFPAFCKGYDEYKEFSKDFFALQSRHKSWLNKVKEDIVSQSLSADQVIIDFFDSVEFYPTTEAIRQKAVHRYDVGNPPGKDHKYGDAINWEILLENVPDGEDLFFISNDSDYASILDNKRFHPFLVDEWIKKKGSHIFYFKSLVEFLQEHFKDIELNAEKQKESVIKALYRSGSFSATHKYIQQLSKYSGWSEQQIIDICTAASENSQIYQIFGDPDIITFYSDLLSTQTGQRVTGDVIAEVKLMIKNAQPDTDIDDDLPF